MIAITRGNNDFYPHQLIMLNGHMLDILNMQEQLLHNEKKDVTIELLGSKMITDQVFNNLLIMAGVLDENDVKPTEPEEPIDLSKYETLRDDIKVTPELVKKNKVFFDSFKLSVDIINKGIDLLLKYYESKPASPSSPGQEKLNKIRELFDNFKLLIGLFDNKNLILGDEDLELLNKDIKKIIEEFTESIV